VDKRIGIVYSETIIIRPKYKDGDGCEDYAAFQERRLRRAREKGLDGQPYMMKGLTDGQVLLMMREGHMDISFRCERRIFPR